MMITGFEFLISEGGTTRWVRLMGAGGLIGDGMLGIINTVPELLDNTKKSLLNRVNDLCETGPLEEWIVGDVPLRERIKTIHPAKVLLVREIDVA